MRLRVTTRAVGEDRPLLDLLPELPDDRRAAFVRGDEGLIAWGVTARLDLGPGRDRFDRADAWFRELAAAAEVDDEVALPGSGPVAIGSFAFDAAARGSVLLVPRTVIGRRDGRTWRTDLVDAGEVADGGTDLPPTAPAGRRTGVDGTGRDDRRPRFAGSSVPDADWLDAVARAVAAIRAGDLEKVVLARDQVLWARAPFDTTGVLHRLAARFPTCTTFLVDRLLGASPETLLELRGDAVRSTVLAGTAPRDPDPDRDAALGAALLASAKDLAEHALAVRSVTEVLAPSCPDLTEPPAPELLRLDNVQHLATTVVGRATGAQRSLGLVGALHPSAAVGGTPRDAALAAIRRLEGMDRDRYAGPVGWTDAAGDGDWAIALRCALVAGDRARLFAGAGVVAGSLPEAELTETWHKLGAMRGVLGAG